MAEKNTESTAVNQLIELVATAKPLPPDPDEDLMFKPVGNTKKVSAPRMTTTIPPVAGAGEVAPLPRARALGTQQGLQTIKAVPPGVRMSTQQRAITIPPLAGAAAKTDYDDDAEVTNPGPSTLARPTTQGVATVGPIAARATGSHAAQRPSAPPPLPTKRESADSIASRVTKPTLPPPLPTMRASSPPPPPAARVTTPAFAAPVVEAPMTLDEPAFRPSLQQTSDFAYPLVRPSMMPATLPADDDDALASILEPKVDASEAGASWLERDIGTQPVPKQSWQAIAGKLVAPMVILVIAGIFIGGYFAFDGDGGKKRTPKASEGQKITMAVTPPAAESAKVEAPAAEPAKVEAPVAAKAETPAAEPAQTETLAAEPSKVEAAPATTPTEPAKTEPAKTEPAKAAAVTPPNLAATTAKAEPSKTEPAKAAVTPPNLAAATAKTEPARTDAAKTDPAKLAPGARPTLVDIRIDSNPAGATVMLIDRGKQTFLGTTPMSAAVDISRKYELVFSYEGRATVVEALDPQVQKKMSVRLSRSKSSLSSSSASAAPAVVASKPVVDKPAVDKPAAVASKPAVDKPAVDKPATDKPATSDKAEHPADKAVEKPHADKPKAAAQAGGEGVLMISSKPPCEIHVDGKPTGLTTPQRAITLPAGAHKITLVNATEGIKKTLSVQITADKPTKVIQDFMK